jgi:hypothetical protein
MPKEKVRPMPDVDLPDQTIVNLEAYVMGTNPPSEIAINLAKLVREVRRRRFEAMELEWRRKFREYGKHLPICQKMTMEYFDPSIVVDCTCGFSELMEKAKFI